MYEASEDIFIDATNAPEEEAVGSSLAGDRPPPPRGKRERTNDDDDDHDAANEKDKKDDPFGFSSAASPTDELGPVEELIPLCVRHASGPLLSPATFGYDIAQMTPRPWRGPNAKLSDYFNYGFNEVSWRAYCAMQANGEASVLAKAKEMVHKQQLQLPTPQENDYGMDPNYNDGDMEGMNKPPCGGGVPFTAYDGSPYNDNVAMKVGERGGYRAPFVSHLSMFNYKTKLCQRFAEGRCTKGSECTYAHGIGELRTSSAAASAPPNNNNNASGGNPSMAKTQAYLIPSYHYHHGEDGGNYGERPPPLPNTG